MCILCKSIVRSETVWPVHLNSKIHRENVTLAKTTKLETESTTRTSNILPFKRSPSPSLDISVKKKIRGILKNSNLSEVQTKSILSIDFFHNNLKQINSVSMQKNESKDSTASIADIQYKEIEEEKIKATNPTVLPEGFFDDPVMDAKVRLK